MYNSVIIHKLLHFKYNELRCLNLIQCGFYRILQEIAVSVSEYLKLCSRGSRDLDSGGWHFSGVGSVNVLFL